MFKKMRKNLVVGIKTVSDFEQGYITMMLAPFKLTITERTDEWLVLEGKVGLAKATRILSFLREKDFEFYLKGEKA